MSELVQTVKGKVIGVTVTDVKGKPLKKWVKEPTFIHLSALRADLNFEKGGGALLIQLRRQPESCRAGT